VPRPHCRRCGRGGLLPCTDRLPVCEQSDDPTNTVNANAQHATAAEQQFVLVQQ
jgi:hypothetical protein